MKYVSAYMLAQIGGKKAPTHDDIHKILGKLFIHFTFLVKGDICKYCLHCVVQVPLIRNVRK